MPVAVVAVPMIAHMSSKERTVQAPMCMRSMVAMKRSNIRRRTLVASCSSSLVTTREDHSDRKIDHRSLRNSTTAQLPAVKCTASTLLWGETAEFCADCCILTKESRYVEKMRYPKDLRTEDWSSMASGQSSLNLVGAAVGSRWPS